MNAEWVRDDLRKRLEGRVEIDWPLAGLTTYRLGGPARIYVEPASADDLVALAETIRSFDEKPPLLVLGRGSNLVISDGGWPGIVVRLGSAFSWLRPVEDAPLRGKAPRLHAGSGTTMPLLANWAARRGLTGLEFAIAIPGSVGGAVRMNAGAHGTETGDSLHVATVFDTETLEVETRPNADLGFSYRRSNLDERHVVLDALWALEASEPSLVRERMDGYRRHRAATQPGAVQNAGSVFKNPPGDSAGRLVEAAGLKGLRVGGASVSTLHANFFIAEEGSTAQDVFDLVHAVRRKVLEVSGVELEPEIRFVGEYGAADHESVEVGT
ncbi:MAG: UDP-N-acetylmuramate dehydrogenase [Actinomycetota bacterium]|nr:UDP-N-acetylmuramate dehydrogenase [Actinomycetota bacterium]